MCAWHILPQSRQSVYVHNSLTLYNAVRRLSEPLLPNPDNYGKHARMQNVHARRFALCMWHVATTVLHDLSAVHASNVIERIKEQRQSKLIG